MGRVEKPNIIEYSVFGRYALFTDPLSKTGREVQLSDTDISGTERDNGIHLLEAYNNVGD